MIIAHGEKRVCFHMVSPHPDTHCIFSFIHEGAEAGQFAGKYPIRIIVGNRPRVRKSQKQLSPRAISSPRDSSATLQQEAPVTTSFLAVGQPKPRSPRLWRYER